MNNPTDQPMPAEGRQDVRLVAEWMFRDMLRARTRIGAERYGTVLQTHNGRDPYQDAMEEAVDLWQYLIQARMEYEDLLEEVVVLRAQLAATAAPSGEGAS